MMRGENVADMGSVAAWETGPYKKQKTSYLHNQDFASGRVRVCLNRKTHYITKHESTLHE